MKKSRTNNLQNPYDLQLRIREPVHFGGPLGILAVELGGLGEHADREDLLAEIPLVEGSAEHRFVCPLQFPQGKTRREDAFRDVRVFHFPIEPLVGIRDDVGMVERDGFPGNPRVRHERNLSQIDLREKRLGADERIVRTRNDVPAIVPTMRGKRVQLFLIYPGNVRVALEDAVGGFFEGLSPSDDSARERHPAFGPLVAARDEHDAELVLIYGKKHDIHRENGNGQVENIVGIFGVERGHDVRV